MNAASNFESAADHLIVLKEVERRVGLKKSAIYARISKGTFPASVGYRDARAKRWSAAAIEQWKVENLLC